VPRLLHQRRQRDADADRGNRAEHDAAHAEPLHQRRRERTDQSVQQDIDEANALGVRGVPFFVLDRKYAISGAQPVDVFKQALESAYTEWKAEIEKNPLAIVDGQTCSPDGDCK